MTRNEALFEQYVIKEGFTKRHVQKTDPEVKMYHQLVSSALEADSFPSHPYIFWRWIAPSTTRARWLNDSLVWLKLYNASGTELPADAIILFGFKVPELSSVTFFAEAPYGHWRRIAIENQGHRDYNESLFVTFYSKTFGGVPFIEIGPAQEFVMAVLNSATLIDKDHANTVVEIDLGVRSA